MSLITKVKELIEWLTENRPNLAPYSVSEIQRYYRIQDKQGHAYCFIAKESFKMESVGDVKVGDLMKPSTFARPAKHARGNLYDRESWPGAFCNYGMRQIKRGLTMKARSALICNK